MSVLPPNVSYYMSRMQGVSTSHFKIFPQSANTGAPSKIVRFELPSNVLCNLKSTRFFFNLETTGNGSVVPDDVSSLIDRIAIYAGGVLIQNGFQGYNSLIHAKSALMGSKCGATLGHPEIVRAKSYHSGGTALGNNDSESYTSLNEQLCIDNWEGLLGSIEPSIIDLGLLPQLTIEIHLADGAVCPIVEGRVLPDGTGGSANNFDKVGSGTPSYEMTNMSMQVEVIGMATSVLDQITEQRMASVGYLSLPFKNYFTTIASHTTSTRFNVNSASWDRLWMAWRPTTYTNKSAPVIVNGYKKAGAFVDDVAGQVAADVDIGLPQYDIGGVLDTNKEKYKSNYFNYKLSTTSGTPTLQLQLNGANVPAYRLTVPEAYAMSVNSIDSYRKDHQLTLDQYKNNYFVQCFRFSLPDSDFNRMASGLDCRSISTQGSVVTEAIDQCNLHLFAECSSELRVGVGRSIEVVV